MAQRQCIWNQTYLTRHTCICTYTPQNTKCHLWVQQGLSGCCNIEYPSETPLKINLVKSRLCITYSFFWQIILNFCTGTETIILCSVKNVETILQLEWMLEINRISRDLSLRCVWEGQAPLQQPPVNRCACPQIGLAKSTKVVRRD